MNNNNNSYMTSPWGPASQAWFSHESAEASLHMEFNKIRHKVFTKCNKSLINLAASVFYFTWLLFQSNVLWPQL